MCAILGGTKIEWNYEGALKTMQHRGPDSSKMMIYDGLTMGFNRLSIMDLTDNGMQPMKSDDGNVVITYNGEIYGFSNLKEDLQKAGFNFKSSSDTEVILNAYCMWGDTFIDKVDGMFSIAIYDKRKGKLILYRDRAGIKPLYYYYDGRDFAYASELKALVGLINDVTLEVDYTALFDYYNYLYIPEPKSIYKNIRKLEPAFKLVYDIKNDKIEETSEYWKLDVNDKEGGTIRKEKCEELHWIIRKAIRNQLVADVPVGVFLSGGIDSSVVAIESFNEDKKISMFSVGFYDYETNELPYVRCLEDEYGFKSIKYFMKKKEYQGLYNMMRDWYDEPYGDTSAYPSYIVSREARKKCTVVLSGDGGDEVFGGYARYNAFNDFLSRETNSDIEKELRFIRDWYRFHPSDDIEVLRKELGIDNDYDEVWLYRKYYRPDLPPITRLQYMDYHTYLCGDILTKMDRVSMAVSLEVRVPFLAKEIVEYSFALTQNERCIHGELKGIIKEIYRGKIPNNLLYRRKAGFAIPKSFYEYDKYFLRDLCRIFNIQSVYARGFKSNGDKKVLSK